MIPLITHFPLKKSMVHDLDQFSSHRRDVFRKSSRFDLHENKRGRRKQARRGPMIDRGSSNRYYDGSRLSWVPGGCNVSTCDETTLAGAC